MPRNTDHLPEPGNDDAIAQHIERVREDRAFQAAPQPEPGEQPDPPKGTVVADHVADAKFSKQSFVAKADVGRFQAGDEIPQGHWSAARLRKFADQGLIEATGERKDK